LVPNTSFGVRYRRHQLKQLLGLIDETEGNEESALGTYELGTYVAVGLPMHANMCMLYTESLPLLIP